MNVRSDDVTAPEFIGGFVTSRIDNGRFYENCTKKRGTRNVGAGFADVGGRAIAGMSAVVRWVSREARTRKSAMDLEKLVCLLLGAWDTERKVEGRRVHRSLPSPTSLSRCPILNCMKSPQSRQSGTRIVPFPSVVLLSYQVNLAGASAKIVFYDFRARPR
jgi:hypothetical protein